MCCLFGLLDYRHTLTGREKSKMLSVLSRECEIRGTDATGIAYLYRDRLRIYKRPLPAHRMHFFIPGESAVVMGHTRMATQGNKRYNPNNHPFEGCCGEMRFALAHNGILRNEDALRKKLRLPPTKIQTDSYAAVQVLEREGTLNFDSLRKMAETVEGSFSFTLLDDRDHLYFVKGSSPLCLYHFGREGFYLYASTEDILLTAVKKLRLDRLPIERLLPECGEIIRLDPNGKMEIGEFDTSALFPDWPLSSSFSWPSRDTTSATGEYLGELKSMAGYYGYTPDDIDTMRQQGYSCGEIEEILYGDDLLEEF